MLTKAAAAVLTVLTAVGVAIIPAATASQADGPRLALIRLSHDPTRYELATVGAGGKGYRGVLRLPPPPGRRYVPFDSPAWSPDGTMLAFRQVARKPSPLFVVASDGSGLRPLPHTRGGSLPVLSPDGRTLAFSRFRREELDKGHDERSHLTHLEFESTSVWTVDLFTGEQRQLTPWRDGLDQLASSYSPDGSTLLLTRIDERRTGEPEVVSLPSAGGRPKLIVSEGILPV